ncbi:MAG: hypothetical protein BWY85_00161 [Firmicutes bacterium ADurb.Bin506]|nr:MAG: hypothetical protein BWY85_00161 [Firmicutes bacterium ADurb.Bin506]
MSELKSLEQADAEARRRHEQKSSGKTGIACPACGDELYDFEPNMVLTSYPPQTRVACKCGWKGTRLA